MKFYQEPIRRARDIQTSKWRAVAGRLRALSQDMIRPLLVEEFDIPSEAVDKLAAAAALVEEAIALVASQTEVPDSCCSSSPASPSR